MNIKKHIPNLITLLNLFCGCIAIVFVADCRFKMAFFFVCLGIFFDFFDGFFARKFGVSGPLGVQLDSLADMVTSGVVPGFAVYKILQASASGLWFNLPLPLFVDEPSSVVYAIANDKFLPYFGFIITLGACYRLAKFNIDTRQSDSFIGLPTPANTIFIMGLAASDWFLAFSLGNEVNFQITLVVISIFSAYVMNAEIPLFSLKIKNFSFEKYKLQIVFLILSVLMILLLKSIAIPLIIITYVLLSVINNKFLKK